VDGAVALKRKKLRNDLARSALVSRCLFPCLLLFGSVPGGLVQNRSATPVILISVDTLRADRLSCYGYTRVRTANIDAMAKGGTRFTQIGSQVPLTFPSHVSLLTSTFPFSNSIMENTQSLSPGVFNLATILKAHGYSTGGFIGGAVLDEHTGLNQGFDRYDAQINFHDAHVLGGGFKRPGEEVTKAAMQWLGEHPEGPFFLFLHLYDLHTPYTLTPAQEARLGGNDYDSELKYVDETLGRFWAFLESKGWVERALIVFLADHGEGLMDHGEPDHGFLLYQTTIRVPLIIHWPRKTGYGIRDTGDGKIETGNSKLASADCTDSTDSRSVKSAQSADYPPRVDEPAGLIDVAPTILQFLGIQPPRQFQGRSLLGLLRENPSAEDREVYSETSYPRHIGGTPLKSLRVGRYKYIDAPEPELYDLSRDPNELDNLYPRQKSVALALSERTHSFRQRYAALKPVAAPALSPEVVERLSSLGYIAFSNSAQPDSTAGVDPKKLLPAYTQTRRAIELAQAGRLQESASLLEGVLARNPDVLDARSALGTVEEKLGQHAQAAKNFREVVQKDPLNALPHYDLAVAEFHLHRYDEASKELGAVVGKRCQEPFLWIG